MAVFSRKDGRWHGVLCANCGGELYSSLPRLSSTVYWWHIGGTSCPKAEPSVEDVKAMKAHNTHGYHLTEQDGKAVQEVLNRYVNEELRPALNLIEGRGGELSIAEKASVAGLAKDIEYITGLAKLFD